MDIVSSPLSPKLTSPLSPQVGELEQRLSSRASEEEQQTQELQNLRDEVETLREEATFKDHCTSELEQAVLYEKERAAGLEVEVQVGGLEVIYLGFCPHRLAVVGSNHH